MFDHLMLSVCSSVIVIKHISLQDSFSCKYIQTHTLTLAKEVNVPRTNYALCTHTCFSNWVKRVMINLIKLFTRINKRYLTIPGGASVDGRIVHVTVAAECHGGLWHVSSRTRTTLSSYNVEVRVTTGRDRQLGSRVMGLYVQHGTPDSGRWYVLMFNNIS